MMRKYMVMVALAALVFAGCAAYSAAKDRKEAADVQVVEARDDVAIAKTPEEVDVAKARLADAKKEQSDAKADIPVAKEEDRKELLAWITGIAAIVLPFAGRRSS